MTQKELEQAACLHRLRKLARPFYRLSVDGSAKGKPFIYECEICGKLLKIASGVLRTK